MKKEKIKSPNKCKKNFKEQKVKISQKNKIEKVTILEKKSPISTIKRKEAFLHIFEENNFNVIKTCKRIGITNKTYYIWYNTDILFKEQINNLKLNIKTYVENKLLELIDSNDRQAIIFYLKTKGGYLEKSEQEITIKDTNIVFELKLNNNNDYNKEFGITSGTE